MGLGAPYGGKQQHERANRGKPHEPQNVENQVGEQQPLLPRAGKTRSQRRAGQRPEWQTAGGTNIGDHARGVPLTALGLQVLPPQIAGVESKRPAHHGGARGGNMPVLGEHVLGELAGDNQQDPNVQNGKPPKLPRSGLLGELAVQEFLREMLRPQHNGVGDNPQRKHVDQHPPVIR